MQREFPFPLPTTENPSKQPHGQAQATSLGEAIRSFGGSFVVHALLFLIPIHWILSARPVASDPELVVTTTNDELSALEPLAMIPIELPVQEISPSRRDSQVASARDKQPEIPGKLLTSLHEVKLVDRIPAPPKEKPILEEQAEPEAIDEQLEQEIQKRLTREGGKSGPIQLSLMWNNGNDVDFYVKTPVGDIIAFNYKKSRCGGELDVDMNAKKPESTKPVENVFWSEKQAPFGEFLVGVHEYQNHGFRDPTPFLVSVRVDGEVKHFRGKIQRGQSVECVCKFRRTKQGLAFLETPAVFAEGKPGKPVFK